MVTNFEEDVWRMCAEIPIGSVSTYQEIARALGKPSASRAVGNALSRNPNAPIVPCHRVVKSDGTLGGYAFGIKKKIELLREEGVLVKNGKIVDLTKVLYSY